MWTYLVAAETIYALSRIHLEYTACRFLYRPLRADFKAKIALLTFVLVYIGIKFYSLQTKR